MPDFIDKVALIHVNDHKVLSTISKNKNAFFFPGGKREPNESDIDCLKREIEEELNVTLNDDTIQFFGTFEAPAHGHAEGVNVRMICYFADYVGELKASNEIESFAWLEFKDKANSSLVDQLIFDELYEKNIIK
ncbi:NUDIX domain-containing protein [Flavobacterium sp. Fl-318]|uniref:NUDIX domain-containing protein n=1 Tax=Flavobacterium cupriresistens TaxID=2893885 RepID=A0ABU4R8U8_9FLAO|nr:MULTISPECIES: NUDIX domain-containing protein [unclassified Flavobacterium]MDX6187945.1 NUDIX domain-containing protein [Flavobacterium sp. Fl-318]UFH42135.1 NUDIX domain-containing protein [Flavobacterium sp. F-323]